MNREIKFRAWDKDKNIMRKITSINWYDEYLWVDETPLSGDRLPFASTPIMQFTGLLDKNGKEVYEGDVIKLESGRIVYVKFKDGGFGYDSLDGESFNSFSGHNYLERILLNMEIIGNTIENPELLQ